VVSILPNPVQIEATAEIRFKGAQALTVDLFDSMGKLIRTQNLGNTTSTRVAVSVVGLPKGMYVVRATTATEKASARLVVQ
jgi:hypothetical protein